MPSHSQQKSTLANTFLYPRRVYDLQHNHLVPAKSQRQSKLANTVFTTSADRIIQYSTLVLSQSQRQLEFSNAIPSTCPHPVTIKFKQRSPVNPSSPNHNPNQIMQPFVESEYHEQSTSANTVFCISSTRVIQHKRLGSQPSPLGAIVNKLSKLL